MVVAGRDAHHTRRFGSAEAERKGRAEGDRHLAEESTRLASTNDGGIPSTSPTVSSRPSSTANKRTLVALMHRVLARQEPDVRCVPGEPVALGRPEPGEDRDAGDVLGGHQRSVPCVIHEAILRAARKNELSSKGTGRGSSARTRQVEPAADAQRRPTPHTRRMEQRARGLDDAIRPVARTKTLRRLTRSLDSLVATNAEPHVVAARVGMLLAPALADPALLETRHCEPAEDRYRQHLVHVHPRGRYSIVALVWKPGQATPIHDHRCWCVVGVWRGLEQETTYDLHGDAGSEYLLPRASSAAAPGSVSVLVPPDEDIHRVENGGERLAISAHIYGADISVLGSSINREFSADLVRPRQSAAASGPLSWRDQPAAWPRSRDLTRSGDSPAKHRRPAQRRERHVRTVRHVQLHG